MASPQSLTSGAVFARDYTILRPLSEGGMGAVYVVQQSSTGMQRALKLMHAELVRDAKLRQRFEQEARVGSRIESEHVVQVLAAGIDEVTGMPWLVMELLKGEDLATLLERRGALPIPEVRDIFAQFTHAIAAAHRVGIVHRDLKPENIFVAVAHREGMTHFVKVLDFGIAKITAEAKATATQALGTPIWMSPEQTEPGKGITPAADVWPLGLMAFRMLTGKHFWHSANNDEATSTMVLREVVFDPLVTASERAREYNVAHLLPAGFDDWFARCVVRNLDARYPNAGEAREGFFDMLRGASLLPSAPRPALAPAPAQERTAPSATPVHAQTPPPATTPAAPYTPVAPFVPPPAPPPKPKRSGGSGATIAAVVGLVVLAGAGLGIRAAVRSSKISACESGKGDDLLEACRAACDAEPKKYCVTHGDLSRKELTTASIEAASKSYEKACKAEDFLGCRKLGSLQELDNESAALASFQKSCDGKNPSGCAWLGKRLERGRGVPRDAQKAISYYEAACAGDDPASCALLGWALENKPVPRPDAAEIDAHFLKAAPALDAECNAGGLAECLSRGALLQRGRGVVERDAATAAKLFHKACEGGLREGCNNGDVMELLTPEGARNAARVAESLKTTCAKGVPAACNNLAVLQAGVPFTLRQQQGVSLLVPTCSAQVTHGCTENGTPITPPASLSKDLGASLVGLDKACTGGLGVACANLGAFHESGLAGNKDPAKARLLYEMACTAGSPIGCGTMKESPFRAGDVWVGTYVCGQGATDLALRILDPSSDQRVSAIFDFSFDHGKVPGRFLVSGAFDASNGTITFSTGPWIEQPPGWVTVGLRGSVSLHRTIFSGKIDHPTCAGFRVVRSTSDMIEPKCAAGSRFVEGHGCVPAPRPGPTVIGTWSGKGVEHTGSSWLMTATLTSLENGRCGTVSYPSLTCTGDWFCTKHSDGKHLRAREIITSGHARCDSTGYIDMTLSDDGQSAEWRWSSPARPGGSTAHLTRGAAAP